MKLKSPHFNTKNIITVCSVVLLSILFSCGKKDSPKTTSIDTLAINYTVISVLPHDTKAFTEGLLIHNNKIYESTGQDSWIAEVNPGTGEQDKKIILGPEYFGEGIAILNNKIYQLTYTTKVGFIYNASTYKKLGEFTYTMQGWGMTHNNKNLIMSDGSDKLYFLDTVTMKIDHTITVMKGKTNIKKLNELEYVDGAIYANVWETPMIYKIDPTTGKVIGQINLSSITNEISQMYPNADVLNGIAYDANSKAFLITGKLWPKAYLIRLK